jgi:Flp pilus assembly protein TadD
MERAMRRGGSLRRAALGAARLAWLAAPLAAMCAGATSTASTAAGTVTAAATTARATATRTATASTNAAAIATTIATGTASATQNSPLTPQARLLATARLWSAKRRDDLALQTIQKALLIAPTDPTLLAQAVRIELRLGNARAAQVTLARLKASEPDAATTLQIEDEFRSATSGREELAMIRLLARSGQAEEAAHRLVALFPHGAPSGALGAEYFRILAGAPAGYADAVAALRSRIAADPSDADAALALVNLLNERAGTRAEANRLAWRLAQRDDADHAEVMNAWRRVLQSAGADAAYVDALRAYLRFEPDDSEFTQRVADIEAQLEARRKLEHDPAYIAQQQGLRALARGDLAAAEPLLSRAVETRANDAGAVGALGLLRLRQGRRAEARALFARAAALGGDRAKWASLARTARVWETIAQGRDAAAAGRTQDAERAAKAALAMEPDNAQAKLLLADAWLAERNWRAAEPLLRELVAAREPSLEAARDLQTLLQDTGRADQVGPLFDALETRFSAADDRQRLAQLRADVLANEAQALEAAGKTGPAAERYEAALRLAPDAPWTRLALARLYRNLGLPQLGRAVMDDGLGRAASPEMRYASALYRNSIDDVAGAQAVLAPIADNARTDGMRALALRLHAEEALARARVALASGDRDASKRALAEAVALGADDADVTASAGALWIDEGDADRGLALLRDWMAAHPRETDIDVQLRYADLLGGAGRNDDLEAWLDKLRREESLSPRQTVRLEDQALRLVLRETDAALEQHDYARARRQLARASAAGQLDPRYALELADLERSEGRYAAARAALAPVLARTPDAAEAQLALARVLEQSGEHGEALSIVRRVLDASSPDDVETRLSAARRLAALRRPEEAMGVTSALRVAYPARPDATVEAGRLAQDTGNYEEALNLYRSSLAQERAAGVVPRAPDGTPAMAALADLEARRDPEIEAGWMPAYKSGDAGISAYHAQQVPVYVQVPYRYDGHFFAHLDAVHLDAGTLALSNPPSFAVQTFGTYSSFATPTSIPAGVLHQQANGVALGVGYASDAWRFDIGTTPLGFPVHYLVGGVRYRFDAGPASFSLSASRRPETSSELSYAGLRDPWTNAVWGGVRRDGVDWHTGIDIGRVSVFSELGAGVMTGRHVAANQEITLRTGFTVPIYERAAMRVATGLVGNVWHYTDNLRFYTFGQGGYYSPQRYLSLGLPIEWNGRFGGLTWDLAATFGISSSYEKDSAYFPNGLPSVPGTLPAATLANLVHTGGSSGIGFSYGVSGTVQYRFNSRFVAGIRIDVDHAHDYAPSSGMLYARYSFDGRKDDNSMSPKPVRLYSSY